MLPPKLSEWPAIKKSFIGLKDAALKGKFLDITVKEATVNTLVAVEIAFWFFVGEVIGRRSLIGYNVWRTFKMYWLFQYFLTECVAKPFDVCVKKWDLFSWSPGQVNKGTDLSLVAVVFCFLAWLSLKCVFTFSKIIKKLTGTNWKNNHHRGKAISIKCFISHRPSVVMVGTVKGVWDPQKARLLSKKASLQTQLENMVFLFIFCYLFQENFQFVFQFTFAY